MSFSSIIGAFEREVYDRKNQPRFKQAQGRHPALAQHQDMASVIALLEDRSPERFPEKDAAIRAMISEQHKSSHSYWTSALMLSFAPMLVRFIGRIHGDAFSGDDLEQLAYTSFLETVDELGRCPELDRLCLRLRLGTQRRVFSQLQGEQQHQSVFCPQEQSALMWLAAKVYEPDEDTSQLYPEQALWPTTSEVTDKPTDHREWAKLSGWIVDLAGDALKPEEVELVIATVVRGESLSSYAACLSRATTPASKRREYERVKRGHSRALKKIRRVIKKKLSPDRGSSPLVSKDRAARLAANR